MQKKIYGAVGVLLESFSITDFIMLPVYCALLFTLSLGTAVWDAFRFYVLRSPMDKMLSEPVPAYIALQRSGRDLDEVKPSNTLEKKLATNTYRTDSVSHIRTLWPEVITKHPEMSHLGLWWVCPARVYEYEALPLSGRGKVTVNYDNCIKCESCWQAEPTSTLWGRHTEHKLIYRPMSVASSLLLDSLGRNFSPDIRERNRIQPFKEHPWNLGVDAVRSCGVAKNAISAFKNSVAELPASTDKSRAAWPLSLGKRLSGKLQELETALTKEGRSEPAQIVRLEKEDIELRLNEKRLFHALYCCERLEQQITSWSSNNSKQKRLFDISSKEKIAYLSYDQVTALFPDRIVKQWEEQLIPDEWLRKLSAFVSKYRHSPGYTVRMLASINPALGLLAAGRLSALRIATKAGIDISPDTCCVYAEHLRVQKKMNLLHIQGTLPLIPVAGMKTILIVNRNKGYLVPLNDRGVVVTPTPAIGFRSAGLSEVSIDSIVKKQVIMVEKPDQRPDPFFYLAIALGAADYLCRRVKEHAVGRIQFPGQMLDTEGRDGIAKFGAVKALISRTVAWHQLLEEFYKCSFHPVDRSVQSKREFGFLCATLAAMAFSPAPGSLGYDAGQVFGGFAYSEDDLLSRSYRDSSIFKFLVPGYGASSILHTAIGSANLLAAIPALGSLDTIHNEPLGRLVSQLKDIARTCEKLPTQADSALTGEAKAIILGIRVLLVSTEQGLKEGRSMEAEAAAVEVLLGMADDAVIKARISSGWGTVSQIAVFPIEPAGNVAPLNVDYEAFCASPGPPHKSGSFLTTAFNSSLRFIPEIQLHDEKLRKRWVGLAKWFKENLSEKKFDGLHVERYIEKIHGLPDELLTAARDNKWLATYIPKSLDGLGWRKAEYYILNSVAGSYGDASIDLLIMASTSIGTTPILLGLEDELPRLREELAPFIQDKRIIGEISARLANLVRTLSHPNPIWIKKEYEEIMGLVDQRVRHTRVVKYLAANFLRAFYGAGIAGKRGDFRAFISNLKRAGGLCTNLMSDIESAFSEIPRREKCHELFLRFLGHGGISAFALTEPTAGSDSGGVKTTAVLHSAKLTQLDDGRYAFYLTEGDETSIRYLIDTDKIVFLDREIAYQTPTGSVPIQHDKLITKLTMARVTIPTEVRTARSMTWGKCGKECWISLRVLQSDWR